MRINFLIKFLSINLCIINSFFGDINLGLWYGGVYPSIRFILWLWYWWGGRVLVFLNSNVYVKL